MFTPSVLQILQKLFLIYSERITCIQTKLFFIPKKNLNAANTTSEDDLCNYNHAAIGLALKMILPRQCRPLSCYMCMFVYYIKQAAAFLKQKKDEH